MVRLRTNSKQLGEMSSQRAARFLGVHVDTIYRWCQRALDDNDGPLKGGVRKSISGWYYIDSDTVRKLAGPQIESLVDFAKTPGITGS